MHAPVSDTAVANGFTHIVDRSKVAVVRYDRSFHLIAAEVMTGGDLVVSIDGVEARVASWTSVQIDTDRHITVDVALDTLREMDEHPWRFLNHSCEPNTMIRSRDVLALRRIRHGEELTFNYNTTEFDMAEPFACRCGSLFCLGTVRGFRYLSARDREHLRPLLAPHLAALHDEVLSQA